MSESKVDWKTKYLELQKKHEETLKLVEALKRQIQTINVEKRYEEKSEITDLVKALLGDRPSFGGGSALRWDLYEKLLKRLYEKKEGNYHEFLRKFARQNGLTEKKLEYGYVKSLIDDGIIEIFESINGTMWRWKAKVK